MDAHVEGFADCHFVDRILIGQVLLLAPEVRDRFCRTVVVAHFELAGRNEHKLHRDAIAKVQAEIFADGLVGRGITAGATRLAKCYGCKSQQLNRQDGGSQQERRKRFQVESAQGSHGWFLCVGGFYNFKMVVGGYFTLSLGERSLSAREGGNCH